MTNKYDFTVFIGRFQPFHRGHYSIVERAMEVSETLIMVLGGADSPRTPRNPFTVKERIAIIKAAVPLEFHPRIKFASVADYVYNDQRWIGAVQSAVYNAVLDAPFRAGPAKVALIGHSKDHTSYYLNLFPTWDSIEVSQKETLSATALRTLLYFHPSIEVYDDPAFSKFMIGYRHREAIKNLENVIFKMGLEAHELHEYKKTWGEGPFITVDSLVVQSGYLLLVKRKDGQGADQWAIPGGFINRHERLVDAAIRELREETKLKVPVPVLHGSITKSKIYDAPHRSERARIITNAFLFELKNGELPKVKGSDDAKEARWFSISEVLTMRQFMFEDHFSIIEDMLGV